MKTELLKIAKDLEEGTITDNEALTLLMGLLSINGNYLIEIGNAYIEDADIVNSYDATGRVSKLWITKEDFDKIKCINN